MARFVVVTLLLIAPFVEFIFFRKVKLLAQIPSSVAFATVTTSALMFCYLHFGFALAFAYGSLTDVSAPMELMSLRVAVALAIISFVLLIPIWSAELMRNGANLRFFPAVNPRALLTLMIPVFLILWVVEIRLAEVAGVSWHERVNAQLIWPIITGSVFEEFVFRVIPYSMESLRTGVDRPEFPVGRSLLYSVTFAILHLRGPFHTAYLTAVGFLFLWFLFKTRNVFWLIVIHSIMNLLVLLFGSDPGGLFFR